MSMERLQQVAQRLARNGFLPQVFATGEDAVQWLADQMEPGQTAAFGGSATLAQLNLAARLQQKQVDLIDDADCPSDDLEAKRAFLRRTICADCFCCSANAILESGCIFNVDGTGNRVAATAFGPGKIFIVAGKNKLVTDLAAAKERLETVAAPQNAKELGRKTPCFYTGKCGDCNSKERMCNIYTLLRRPSRITPTYVVLIDEALGY